MIIKLPFSWNMLSALITLLNQVENEVGDALIASNIEKNTTYFALFIVDFLRKQDCLEAVACPWG